MVIKMNLHNYNATINDFYISIGKVVFIDAAFAVTTDGLSGAISTYPDVLKYYARSSTLNLPDTVFTNIGIDSSYITTTKAVVAGSTGAIIKNLVTPHKIAKDIINNVGYELFDTDKTLSASPANNFIFTVCLESIDSTAQSIFSYMSGGELAIKAPDLMSGLMVASIVEVLYVPNDKYIPDLINCTNYEQNLSCMHNRTEQAVVDTIEHLNDIFSANYWLEFTISDWDM